MMADRSSERALVIFITIIVIWLSSAFTLTAIEKENADRIKKDRGLLVPGGGTEMVVLGELFRDTVARIGKPGKSARFETPKEIFSDVMGIKTAYSVRFDRLYHYNTERCTVFVCDGRVVALASLNTRKTTPDGVSLEKGISYFILHYGNRDCDVLMNGRNRFYLYGKLGIALADDSGNDSIDLFIIFTP